MQSSSNLSRQILLATLSLGTLVRCDCEEVEFTPAAQYTPATNVDFGLVSVSSQKKIDIRVLSSGSAALKLLSAYVPEDQRRKFIVKAADDLTTGLAPMRTSSISVTYRPCPDAWE